MPQPPIDQLAESDQVRADRLEGELRSAFFVRRNLESELARLRTRFPQTAESIKLDWGNRDARGKFDLLLEIQNAIFACIRHDMLIDKPWRNKERAREIAALVAEAWALMCASAIDGGAISFADPPARGGGFAALAIRFDVLCGAQAAEDEAELVRCPAGKVDAKIASRQHAGRRLSASRNVSPSCSFCGKSAREATTLIAGPSSYICDECVGLCGAIIDERAVEAKKGQDAEADLTGAHHKASAATMCDCEHHPDPNYVCMTCERAKDTLSITRAEAELFHEALGHLPGFVGMAEQDAALTKLGAFLNGKAPTL